MVDEEYIGYIEGYLATTNLDSQGDKLTPQALESFTEWLKKNPAKRTLHLNHDMTQPIGYVTDFYIETKGDWQGLRARVGIYKTRPDAWEMCQSGKLTGFSYGAKFIYEELGKMSKEECSFTVEIKGLDYHEFMDMLAQMGARVEVYVQKAADFPTILTVACSLLGLPGTIYGIYTMVKKKSAGTSSIKIKTSRRELNFNDHTVEEITKEIEMTVKDSKG